jgi:DNA replication protein DnaC
MLDPKIAQTCPAQANCKQHNISCSTLCPLWIDLKYQLELSGIPKRHQKFRIDNLPEDTYALNLLKKWSANDMERVEAGQGLYLYGNTGNGKTTAICSLAITFIVNKSLQDIRNGVRTKQLVQFVNVPDLLDLLKRGFDDPEVAAEGNAVLESLKDCPLVLFDDIGAERPSQWQQERLLTLIGHRYDNELSTFFSSNLTIPELTQQLGPRLKSRIEGMTVPLEYKGPDRRKKL